MEGRYEGFTNQAREVLSLAQQEARALGHTHVGPEHMLLGLLREQEGLAARALTNLGVDLTKTRCAVEVIVRKGEHRATGEIGLIPLAQRAVELAREESGRLGHDHVGTEHLLLGLTRLEEGMTAGLFESVGASPERIRSEVIKLLTQQNQRWLAVGVPDKRDEPEASFDQFTNSARLVMTLAEAEAQRFNQNYIGTEHILLGLIRGGDPVATTALSNLGVDLNKVRSAVEFIIGRGEHRAEGEIGLTPRAKKAVELARLEARGFGHDHVGPEDLLLGVIREGEGIAAGVLESLGVTLSNARNEVLRVAGGAVAPETEDLARSGSFDRFTERSRRTLTFTQEEAHRFGHNYIAPEHILLGIVREGGGVAAKVLSLLGTDTVSVRQEVELAIRQQEDQPNGSEIGLTFQARKVIELAVDEARRLGHHYIGTEHLLLGLMREGSSIAAQVLEGLGVKLDRTRSEVKKVLTGETSFLPSQRERAASQWEYLSIQTVMRNGMARVHSLHGGTSITFEQDQTPIHIALNDLGLEGWELVGVDVSHAHGVEDRALYVLKRRL